MFTNSLTARNSSIPLSDVGLVWPDGPSALQGFTGTFGVGPTVDVHANRKWAHFSEEGSRLSNRSRDGTFCRATTTGP